jgi:putative membrane protein
MLRITLAVLHLLALGIGLGAIYARARALGAMSSTQEPAVPDGLRRAFAADAWWGLAALLWVSTGLWRALAGTEKAPGYYWSNHVFYAKMALFILVVLLEVWPMTTLIRWRRAAAKHTLPPSDELARTGRRLARVSDVQTLLVVAIVVAAVTMARGYGARA